MLRSGARFPGGVAPTNLMYAFTAAYIKWIFRARLIPKESAPPLRTTMVLVLILSYLFYLNQGTVNFIPFIFKVYAINAIWLIKVDFLLFG